MLCGVWCGVRAAGQALVRDRLASELQVYVEYRQGFPDAGSMNRNAVDTHARTHERIVVAPLASHAVVGARQAINSLTVWNIWEAVFGAGGTARLVNVAAESACLGCGLETFGRHLQNVVSRHHTTSTLSLS